jgi:hypothetical protein
VNPLVGFLLVVLLILMGIITKLRSDLYQTRWTVYRLMYMALLQDKIHAEFWEAPDPRVLIAYVEGGISLQELFQYLQQKYRL